MAAHRPARDSAGKLRDLESGRRQLIRGLPAARGQAVVDQDLTVFRETRQFCVQLLQGGIQGMRQVSGREFGGGSDVQRQGGCAAHLVAGVFREVNACFGWMTGVVAALCTG